MTSIKVRGLPPPQDHGHTTGGDGGALGTGVVDTTQLADEAVDNVKVAAAAAIAKSKLAALEIADADVAAAAAIDQSKVALAITDSEVAVAAAIAQSKVSLAITDSEVAAGADISKDKLAVLARTGMYHGDEVEVQITGTTEEQVKDLAIILDPTNALDLQTLRIVARMKTSLSTAQASLAFYHDGGGVADLTLASTSETYEEKSGTIDVSGWAAGRHTIEIKLVSDNAAETAYNELLEIYGVQ